MKRIVPFLFFIFYFSLFTCVAQSHFIDSLKQIVKEEKDDTNRVKDWNTLSDKLWQIGSYDTAITYANSAQALAEKLGYIKGQARAFYTISVVYVYQGNYPQALEYCLKALAIYQTIGYKKGIASTLRLIGYVYLQQGNYAQALEYYLKALAINQEMGNKDGIANNFGQIGSVYTLQGNYPQALEYLLKSLAIEQELYKTGSASNYSNIGNIYLYQHNYPQALAYYFKALTIDRKMGDKDGTSSCLYNIGGIYMCQSNYSQALEYYFKALPIEQEIGDKKISAFSLINIGTVYTREKNFKQAKAYLDSSLVLSKNIESKDVMRAVYAGLADFDSATGNYQKAWEDYKTSIVYRDSLINETEIKKSTQAEMNYEFGRKTDSTKAIQAIDDAVAAKEKQRQKMIRNSLVGGFSIMFLASGIFFFQRRRISKEKKRSDELLLNILPAEVAEELKEKGSTEAKSFDEVTVMFTDFKGFTAIAEKLSAKELVAEIDYCFKGFDNIVHKYNIEKIKTIGDSYMAAGGLPIPNKTHAKDIVSAALEIVKFMEEHKQNRLKEGKPVFEIRIGINSGHVVAGIVGIKKFAYDIWGDTVNLASRMESSGEPGKVNISGSTYELVKNDFVCTYRGKIQAKNKGEVDMYFVI